MRTHIFGANLTRADPQMLGKRWQESCPPKSTIMADRLRYRKGSMSFKGSNTRRESIARRAAMRLGGLRVITAGGVSCGVDAALYLAGAMVSDESAAEAARIMQWTWTRGVVIDGLDV